ncbi:MAG: DnaJ family molecular chaperone [Terriglobales bacterium]
MTPGIGQEFWFLRMSLEAVELNSIEDLYAFVESAVAQTGLILDSDACYRPWARTLAADCRDVRWVYPSRALSEQLLQHLSNFAHERLPEKGFVLIAMGRVLKALDVGAIGGSNQPHRLAAVVQEAFNPKRRRDSRSRFRSAGESSERTENICTDPYSLLEVSEQDSDQEIKRKYRQLLLQYHPDRVAHLGAELRDLAAKKTTAINTAFAAIRNRRGF